MKKNLNSYEFMHEFIKRNRDDYSYFGYEALFDYYDAVENYDLDVIAICCEVSEFDKKDILNNYSYLVDEELDKDEQFSDLIKQLEFKTNIVKLDNGSYLVWDF